MSEKDEPESPVNPQAQEPTLVPEVREYERYAELYQGEIVAAFRSKAARKLRDPCVWVTTGPGQPAVEVVETLAALGLLACGQNVADVPRVPRAKGERLVVIGKSKRAYVFLVRDLVKKRGFSRTV
jgi:hypothetical protein